MANPYFRFLTDEERRQKWAAKIRRLHDDGRPLQPGPSVVICSAHFTDHDLYYQWSRKLAKRDAVPALFSFSNLSGNEKLLSDENQKRRRRLQQLRLRRPQRKQLKRHRLRHIRYIPMLLKAPLNSRQTADVSTSPSRSVTASSRLDSTTQTHCCTIHRST